MTRGRVLLPALVLTLVALVQVVLTRTEDLSPWKGGGFGMFATTDGSGFRRVRLFVEAPERSEEVELTTSIEDVALRTALFPSASLMNELAEAVVARERRRRHAVNGVRVEVWRTEFTEPGPVATERRLRSFVLLVPRES